MAKQDLRREADQMFINPHRLLREDEQDCPECGHAEKVRPGAHIVHHLIGSGPSNDHTTYMGGNARRRMQSAERHRKCSEHAGQGRGRTIHGGDGGDAASLTMHWATCGA